MSEDVRSNLRPGDQKELNSTTLPFPGKLESSCTTGSATSLDSQVSIVITTPSSPRADGNSSDQAFIWPTECQNMLLDPGIVNDTQTQALLLTTLVSLLFTFRPHHEAGFLYCEKRPSKRKAKLPFETFQSNQNSKQMPSESVACFAKQSQSTLKQN